MEKKKFFNVFAHIAYFNFDYSFVIYTKFKHKTHKFLFYFNLNGELWERWHTFNHVTLNFYLDLYDTSFYLYWYLKAYNLTLSVTMLYEKGELCACLAAPWMTVLIDINTVLCIWIVHLKNLNLLFITNDNENENWRILINKEIYARVRNLL